MSGPHKWTMTFPVDGRCLTFTLDVTYQETSPGLWEAIASPLPLAGHGADSVAAAWGLSETIRLHVSGMRCNGEVVAELERWGVSWWWVDDAPAVDPCPPGRWWW